MIYLHYIQSTYLFKYDIKIVNDDLRVGTSKYYLLVKSYEWLFAL